MKKGQLLDAARWWPAKATTRSCWFCERGTAPGHLHIPSKKARAA